MHRHRLICVSGPQRPIVSALVSYCVTSSINVLWISPNVERNNYPFGSLHFSANLLLQMMN